MLGRNSQFIRCEAGAAAVELAIWVPLFALILQLCVDASLSLLAHSRMWDVARDTVRQVAIGSMSNTEAVDYAQSAAIFRGHAPTVAVSDASTSQVFVQISMPVAKTTLFNFVGVAGDGEMQARAIMMREPQ